MNSGIKMGKLHSAMENSRWRSYLDQKAKNIQYDPGNTRKDKDRECCMCGDVGFQDLLFKCHRCHHRFQHLYCSRLYPHQLNLEGVNVCDWCLDFQAKEKIQSHKRKVKLQKMESNKDQKVVESEIVFRSPSTSAMKQPATPTMKKTRKADAKPGSLKLPAKFGGKKKNQPSNLLQVCKVSTELYKNVPRTSTNRSPTKGGFHRRYKLLSDVLSSKGKVSSAYLMARKKDILI